MDIYSYINSPDVAAYCREINKTWSPFEMAVIVGRSERSISDKHAGLRQIAAEYPDMPTPGNMHVSKYDSLHYVIATVIEYEERLISLFKMPGPNIVYSYEVKFHDDYRQSEKVFSSYEKALADIKDSYERDEPDRIKVTRASIDNAEKVEAYIDYDEILYDIYFICGQPAKLLSLFNIPADFDYNIFDYCFFIDIPIPFKCGDILTVKSGLLKNDRLFVFESSVNDEPERYERLKNSCHNDGTDLMGWGNFVSEGGDLYGDHAGQHDCYEYYRGKLDGVNALLHYVSLFLKKEIGLPELLVMQCRIFFQRKLDKDLRVDIHGRVIPEYLLAENRIAHGDQEEGNGLKPWVAKKLSIHQVEFLVREFGADMESTQIRLSDGGGFYLGDCASIVHDEKHYMRTGNTKYNPSRMDMARMVLEAYGHTEDGWLDSYKDNGDSDIDSFSLPIPDYRNLNKKE